MFAHVGSFGYIKPHTAFKTLGQIGKIKRSLATRISSMSNISNIKEFVIFHIDHKQSLFARRQTEIDNAQQLIICKQIFLFQIFVTEQRIIISSSAQSKFAKLKAV